MLNHAEQFIISSNKIVLNIDINLQMWIAGAVAPLPPPWVYRAMNCSQKGMLYVDVLRDGTMIIEIDIMDI